MKNLFRIGFASLCMLAFFSCNKEENPDMVNSGEILVSFEAGPLEIAPESKVLAGELTSGKYPMSWENGDQISIIFHNAAAAAGKPSEKYVVNNSKRYFTTTGDGNFSGMLDLDELSVLGGEKSGGLPSDLACFMIYPATNLTVSSTSIQDSANPSFYYYEVTGAEIAEVQDGTGWPYCYFTSLYISFGRSWKGFSGTTRKFVLSNTLLRFKLVNSEKDIKNIKIETNNPQFVGPVTFWMGLKNTTEYAYTGGSDYQYFKAGGDVKVLNIRKDDNSALPDDIWFACCKGLETGKTLKFTFTSTDDKTCVVESSAPKWMGNPQVYNLGELNLAGAVWE